MFCSWDAIRDGGQGNKGVGGGCVHGGSDKGEWYLGKWGRVGVSDKFNKGGALNDTIN